MLKLRLLVLVGLAAVVAATAQAAPHLTLACPAPKPLPASVKRPPKGASATQLANFLLALPQRKPCDVHLFTSRFFTGTTGFYPEGSQMEPADGPLLSEQQVRAQLVAFTRGRPGRAETMRLFDHPQASSKITSPSLRAALAALYGTAAEGTIDMLLRGNYTVRFGGVSIQELIAMVSGGSTPTVIFNRRYEREHFALLTGILAHEIFHHDSANNQTEEAILNTLTAVVHMQLLARHPELATSGTELSRQLNDLVVVFVNSRIPGSSRSAIVAPGGKGTAPGSAKSAPDVLTYFSRRPQIGYGKPSKVAPAPPAFATVLRKLLAPNVAIPKPLTFSKKTAALFSKMNDTWLSPVDRLRVSVLLGLVSMEEITAYTGLTRAKAISTFRLRPILAVK